MSSEILDLDGWKEELAEYSQASFWRGLISGTGGNLSLRIPGTDQVLVTPSGISLAEVEPENVIMVDLEGAVVEAPKGLVPSKETGFHLEGYRARDQVLAVAHLHPPYATAFANKRMELPMCTVSARGNLRHVPWIKTAIPGSPELRENVARALAEDPGDRAFLMEEHGTLVLAQDLKTAFYLTDLLEDTAKIAYFEMNIRG